MFIYFLFSYLIGNILTAWLVGKWKGVDLTKERSGNLGARNAGAVIGKLAFILTFLGDAGKGAALVFIGFYFDFPLWAIAFSGLLAVIGHIFPFWLRGRGGKGIAVFIGVTFFLTPELFLAMFVLFIAFYPLFRSATLCMLSAFTAFIVMAAVLQVMPVVWPLIAAIIIIVIKHRFDIEESYVRRFSKS
ncbi:glycerol-3-phosphate acyltransferase [Planococcus beigongshangi]|uniref:glycerol-3-phosphate acyltransferase n=1 Tax=Planococcus beigongshangi TaxID=2782536 RepID=UPI00193C242B|nr:glycerol-3-phosphate acyltransferase [Planococcus beigongshangi]